MNEQPQAERILQPSDSTLARRLASEILCTLLNAKTQLGQVEYMALVGSVALYVNAEQTLLRLDRSLAPEQL